MPFDFNHVSVPFRMQPGLRRIAPGSAQLTPTTNSSRHLREKIAVLATHAGLHPERGADGGEIERHDES